MIISHDEYLILQINFYCGSQTLIQVGYWHEYVKYHGGRMESFDIADGEQLIGCELEFSKDCFEGVTWFKMKLY